MEVLMKAMKTMALVGALLASLCLAQPAMSATPRSARDCPRTIGNEDQGTTVKMVAGTCATLSLNPELIWTTPVSSSSAVKVTDTETFAPDSMWTLNAIHAGDATITASGRPNCKPGQICPLFIVEFRVHIHVVGSYGGRSHERNAGYAVNSARS
jgi:hypothetical protein